MDLRGGSMTSVPTLRERFWRETLTLALFCVAFFFAYRYGMSFSQALASPFWFPDSVLLCALLVTPPRRWALYVLAALPIRVFSPVAAQTELWFLLTTFLIDSGKCLLMASLLRRFVGTPIKFESVPQFARYLLIAVLLVPALSALAGAGARTLLGRDFWSSWDQWWMGNAMTQLIVTPAILYWVVDTSPRRMQFESKRALELGLLIVGLLIATWLAANTGEGSINLQQARFYAPIPFLFWAALRFGMIGATGSIAVFSGIVIHAALQGHGPFVDFPADRTAHALQNFLLLRAAPLYLVAVVVEQRWHTERSLRESEERFRSIANAAPVMIWLVDRHQRNEFCNDGWLTFVGRTLQQELGDGWSEAVHPDDLPRMRKVYDECFVQRTRFEFDYRHRRFDGEYRWVNTTGVPRYAPDGEFLGFVGAVTDITDRRRAKSAAAIRSADRGADRGHGLDPSIRPASRRYDSFDS